MSDYLHALWIILGVIVFVEFIRQLWRANRCEAEAGQRSAVRDAASPDRKISKMGFELLHHLKRKESWAFAFGCLIRILAAVVIVVWVQFSLR